MCGTVPLQTQSKRKEDDSMKLIATITILSVGLLTALGGTGLACDLGIGDTKLTSSNPCDLDQKKTAVTVVRLYGCPDDRTVEIAGLANFNPCDFNQKRVLVASAK